MENKIKKYYGQYGQDTIIKQFFDHKNINNGIFVDIGASEGKRLSNTLLLEEYGWTGICVEAHPSYFNILKSNRPNSICYSVAVGNHDKVKTPISLNYRASLTTLDLSLENTSQFRGKYYGSRDIKEINGFLNGIHEVEMRTIDSIIDENKYKFPKINLICIDIDGSEKYAFQGLTLDKYSPEILILEHTIIGIATVNAYARGSGYIPAMTVGSDIIYTKTEEDVTLLNRLSVQGEQDMKSMIHVAGLESGEEEII